MNKLRINFQTVVNVFAELANKFELLHQLGFVVTTMFIDVFRDVFAELGDQSRINHSVPEKGATLNTSATVVIPAATFIAPLNLRVFIPSFIADLRSLPISTPVFIKGLIPSVSGNNS